MSSNSTSNINYISSINNRRSSLTTYNPPPSSPIPIPSSSSPATISSPASDFVVYKDSYSYPLSSPSFSPNAFDSPHTPPTDPELDLDFDFDFATIGMHPNNYTSDADYFASQWLNDHDPILPSSGDIEMDSMNYSSSDYRSCMNSASSVTPGDLIAHPQMYSMSETGRHDDETEADVRIDLDSAFVDTPSPTMSWPSHFPYNPNAAGSSSVSSTQHQMANTNALALQHVGADIDPSSTAIASSGMTINYASAASGPGVHFPLIGNNDEDVDFGFNLDGEYDITSLNTFVGTADNGNYCDINSVCGGLQEHGVSMNKTAGIGKWNSGYIIGRGAVTSGIGATSNFNYTRPSSSSNAHLGFFHPRIAGIPPSSIPTPTPSTAPRLLLRSTSHHTHLSQAAASLSPLSTYASGLDTPLYSNASSAPAESTFHANYNAPGSSFLFSEQQSGAVGGASSFSYEHGQRHGHVKRPSVMSMFGSVPPADIFLSGTRAFSSNATDVNADKDATMRARVRTKSETGNHGNEVEDKDATIHAYSSRSIKVRGRLGNLKMKKEDDMDVDFGSTSGVEADVDMDVDMDPDATVRRRRRKRRDDDFSATSPTQHASSSASPQSQQTPLKSSLKPPKLAPSTWQLYFTDWIQRHQVSSGLSGSGELDKKLNVAQAAKEAGTEYAKLSEEQKEPFKRRSVELKEQRQRELTLWQKNLSPADIKRENAYRAAQRRAGKSRKANLKDPNAPKKPLSAYFMFLAWIRSDEARTKHVFGDERETTGQSVLAAKKWREMSDEDRRPFLARAEKEKLDYEAARRLYEDSAPGIETTISFNTDDSDINFYNTSAMTASSGYWSTASPSPSPLMSTMTAPPLSNSIVSNVAAQTTCTSSRVTSNTELQNAGARVDEDQSHTLALALASADSVNNTSCGVNSPTAAEQPKSTKRTRAKSLATTAPKGTGSQTQAKALVANGAATAAVASADISISPPVTRSSTRRTRASVGMF